ncbi:MAG: Rrf2 family transcriptional regulator [Bacteroidales bacterium]|nr:Rrf2 family transcriptional regulator [Bacteroidales bacterium]
MFSNSCRYGIRAILYIASKQQGDEKTGIKQISKDLDLPTPFLAKILQQLAKQKILKSLKGPHGGFSLLRDPKKITILDIVKTIDGEEIFTNCIIHNTTCSCVDKHKDPCPLHDNYSKVRTELINLFSTTTVHELVINKDTQARINI